MLNAIGEQRPVGEVGHRVVEGLVCELVFERLAFADVAAVEDDPSDMFVLEQICVLDLELQPRTITMLQGTLDHMGFGATAGVCVTDTRNDLRQARPIGLAH